MKKIFQKLIFHRRNSSSLCYFLMELIDELLLRIITMNCIYFLERERIMTKNYQVSIKNIGANGVIVGNYSIGKRFNINE